MRVVVGVVSVVAGTLVVTPPTGAATTPPPPDPGQAVLAPLVQATDGTVGVGRAGVDGAVTFLGAAPGTPLSPPSDDDPGAIARRAVDAYGSAFGVANARRELVEERRTDGLTGTAVRFRQAYRGVPVLGGTVTVSVDDDGSVQSILGEASPRLGLDTTPAVTASAAEAAAVALTAKLDGVDAALLTASPASLWVYDPRLLGAPGLPGARLVWRTSARNELGDVDRFVLVDAATGGVALQFSQVAHARNRQVCDNENDPDAENFYFCLDPVLVEGDDTAGLSEDAINAYVYSGFTYDFYFDVLGRDSIDGEGMPLVSTVRFCLPPDDEGFGCPYDNAFWDGTQMVYGEGYASALDVVSHELTHGVTQYTSQLLYFAQSGAINESMSDVFGQIVQLYAGQDDPEWLLGEDLTIGAIRSMKDPTLFDDPDRMTSPNYWADPADGWGVHFNSGVNNKAAYLMAQGGTFNGRNMGAGIGIVKTARVYYQAQTALLNEASDYRDLAVALPQACNTLVRNRLLDAADCDVVRAAVAATEMELPPTAAEVNLGLPACPAGQAVITSVLSDDFENGLGAWTQTTPLGSALWANTQASATTKVLRGPAPLAVADTRIRTTASVSIPTTGTTFLQFRHAFDLEGYGDEAWYDGGVVEYSTTGGSGAYSDVAGLTGAAVRNGYTGTLDASPGNANPLGGRPAFTGTSPGFVTTQVDLSALAGKSVNLRFRIGSDPTTAFSGWLIDDVRIYQCGDFAAFVPCRAVDTRPAPDNVGVRSTPLMAGEAYAIPMWGAAGNCSLPTTASSLSMNVTVVGARQSGFLTLYPCDASRPPTSNLNFAAGQTVSAAVMAKVSASGTLCVYASGGADVVIDVNGMFPAGAALAPVAPARLVDTRPGYPTSDGAGAGAGPLAALSTMVVQVAGRGGVPSGATTALLNVTSVNAVGAGFITVFPCDAPRPSASSLNYGLDQVVPNLVATKLSAAGTACLYTNQTTDVVVDVSGYFAATAAFTPLVPTRLLETRVGEPLGTIDGQSNGIGVRSAGQTTTLQVTGRGGVREGARSVMVNLTATQSEGGGFVTVYPCDQARPTASSLNFAAGETRANAVVTKLSATGTLCLYTNVPTHLVVDVTGFFPAITI